MRKLQTSQWIWTLAVIGLLGAAGAVRADHPLAGKWKVNVLSGGSELSVWLIQIDDNDGKFSAKLLSAGMKNFESVQFDTVKVSDKAVHLNLILHGYLLHLSAYVPKGAKNQDTLLGSLLIPPGLSGPGGAEPIRLERTELKEIDPKKVKKDGPGSEELTKFSKADSEKEAMEILKGIIKKYPDEPVALISAFILVKNSVLDAKADELKKHIDGAHKVAARYGPEIETVLLRDFAEQLAKSEKAQDLAVEYAQQARTLIQPSTPAWDRELTLIKGAKVLKQVGKDKDVKEFQEELAKLGPQLDQEFKKTAIPFTPEEFKGRKGKSNRVAVLELFTGTGCPPCVVADVAFDGLLKTYHPKDVILLQYHVHIPSPDPLTNADSDYRAEKYYDVTSAPSILINGKIALREVVIDGQKKMIGFGGTNKPFAKESYNELKKRLDEQLEKPGETDLSLKATREGDFVSLEAKVSKLKEPGKKIRLRFVVIEDEVHYPGGNRQRFHHHVVRGFLGGVDGVALTQMEGTYAEKLNLKKLKLKLIDYLAEQSKELKFLDDARPLELKHLKVVALIQNDTTKEILNAAQVDVPAK